MNRENVINVLELCTSEHTDVCLEKCPYAGWNASGYCIEKVMVDALELLKAQEPVEPKKVNRYFDVDDEGHPYNPETYDCGSCGMELPQGGRIIARTAARRWTEGKKMRLIDVDALDKVLVNIQSECKRNGGNFRFGVLSNVRANIAEMPTVDAIPVEWLENRLNTLCFEAMGAGALYGDRIGELAKSINDVINLWRKEQEG